MDFSDNPMAEPDFKFYDKSLLDDVKRGDPNVDFPSKVLLKFFDLLDLALQSWTPELRTIVKYWNY